MRDNWGGRKPCLLVGRWLFLFARKSRGLNSSRRVKPAGKQTQFGLRRPEALQKQSLIQTLFYLPRASSCGTFPQETQALRQETSQTRASLPGKGLTQRRALRLFQATRIQPQSQCHELRSLSCTWEREKENYFIPMKTRGRKTRRATRAQSFPSTSAIFPSLQEFQLRSAGSAWLCQRSAFPLLCPMLFFTLLLTR